MFSPLPLWLEYLSPLRANEPTAAKAAWITGRLFAFLRWQARPAALKGVFQPEIFRRAKRRVRKQIPDLEFPKLIESWSPA